MVELVDAARAGAIGKRLGRFGKMSIHSHSCSSIRV